MIRKHGVRIAWIAVLICALAIGTASAAFDASEYTYEELMEIKQQVDNRLEELNRQYAIEHADRIFSFAEAEQVVYIGESTAQQPDVTIVRDDAPATTQFIWTSSSPEIASVTENGTVKALTAGDAVITAAAADNPYLSASYTVHAAVPVEQITVWGLTEALVLDGREEDAEAQLGISIEPEDAYYQDVIWTSSDETIVTVDEAGMLRGLQPGRAIITVTSAAAETDRRAAVQATCEVQVLQAVTGITCEPTLLQMNTGDRKTLKAIAEPESASNPAIRFTSTNPEIASVDEKGNIISHECGECDIICEAEDGYGATATCQVQVTKQVTQVSVEEEQIRLPIGGTYTVNVTILPEDATEQRLIWTSTNVFVARVAAGKIEAVGQGDCEIICTTLDGSNITASVKVHVPTFSVEATEYSVGDRQGIVIPVIRNQAGCTVEMETTGTCFTASWIGEDLRIDPLLAGTDVIRLSNPDAPGDTIEIQITIENSAVFNQESYPAVPYMLLAGKPEEYENAQISIYGKVLNHYEDETGAVILMVGTGGEAYTDQVIQTRCGKDILPEGIQIGDGDIVTVFGLYTMERTYSEALQAETSVPALTAEKIIINESAAAQQE